LKTSQVVQLIKIGWELIDLRELCKQSKEFEKVIVLKRQKNQKVKKNEKNN